MQCSPLRRTSASLRCTRAGIAWPTKGKVWWRSRAAQLDDLSVQREALIGEHGFAEADSAAVFIERFAGGEQPHMDGVKMRIVEVPELDAA